MERRHFLQFFALSGPAVVAADSVHRAGGEVNIADAVQAARAFIEPLNRYVDRQAHGLYDLLQIPKGETVPKVWSFFSVPVGAPRPGVCQHCGMGHLSRYDCKTILDTNNLRANSFPPPESGDIDRICFLFSPAMDERDRNLLATRFYFEFQVGSRVVARAPLARARAVGDIRHLVSLPPADALPSSVYGRRIAASPLDAPFSLGLIKPVHIAPLQHFAFELHGEAFEAHDTIELYAFLDGTHDFAVQ